MDAATEGATDADLSLARSGTTRRSAALWSRGAGSRPPAATACSALRMTPATRCRRHCITSGCSTGHQRPLVSAFCASARPEIAALCSLSMPVGGGHQGRYPASRRTDCLQYCERSGGDVGRTDACPEIRAPSSTPPQAPRGLPGGRRSAPTTWAACSARPSCCGPATTSRQAGSAPVNCGGPRTPPSARWSAGSRRPGCARRPTVSCAANPGTWTSSTSSAASRRCRTTRSGWRSTTSGKTTNGRHRPRTSSPRSRSGTRSSARRSRSCAIPSPPRCPSSPSPR